jgi:hypothetical protein
MKTENRNAVEQLNSIVYELRNTRTNENRGAWVSKAYVELVRAQENYINVVGDEYKTDRMTDMLGAIQLIKEGAMKQIDVMCAHNSEYMWCFNDRSQYDEGAPIYEVMQSLEWATNTWSVFLINRDDVSKCECCSQVWNETDEDVDAISADDIATMMELNTNISRITQAYKELAYDVVRITDELYQESGNYEYEVEQELIKESAIENEKEYKKQIIEEYLDQRASMN